MTLPEFNLIEKEKYTIIDIKLEGVIEPEILKSLSPPRVNFTKGVILSGRCPVWLFSYLTHYYHPSIFVATYDPRLGGAVIVESHHVDYNIGDIIKLDI
ncbi:MAG: CRISPR-associated ring nuclease Crn3/Csx3 [Candidatus Helarchaeota archaeon]